MTDKQYEKDCESIQASNEKQLKKFEDYLREKDDWIEKVKYD